MKWNLIHCLINVTVLCFIIFGAGDWILGAASAFITISIMLFLIIIGTLVNRDHNMKILRGCYQAIPDDLKDHMAKAVLELGYSPTILDDNLSEE